MTKISCDLSHPFNLFLIPNRQHDIHGRGVSLQDQLQETLNRALLDYSAAYSMARLSLDGRLEHTTLVPRVNATLRFCGT